jgi:hypothetical protein
VLHPWSGLNYFPRIPGGYLVKYSNSLYIAHSSSSPSINNVTTNTQKQRANYKNYLNCISNNSFAKIVRKFGVILRNPNLLDFNQVGGCPFETNRADSHLLEKLYLISLFRFVFYKFHLLYFLVEVAVGKPISQLQKYLEKNYTKNKNKMVISDNTTHYEDSTDDNDKDLQEILGIIKSEGIEIQSGGNQNLFWMLREEVV